METGKARNEPVVRWLHPVVYRTIIGFALLLILSAWWGFASALNTDFVLFVVSGFIFFSVLIPTAAWWTWHRHRPRGTFDQAVEPFGEWEEEEFETWQGRLTGREAAMQVLLPIAAVAFGMLAFAIVAHVAG
jgi:hypothetical protein